MLGEMNIYPEWEIVYKDVSSCLLFQQVSRKTSCQLFPFLVLGALLESHTFLHKQYTRSRPNLNLTHNPPATLTFTDVWRETV